MYAVVNHFSFKSAIPQELIDQMQRELVPRARAFPGVRDYYFIRTATDHAVVVVLFDTPEAERDSTQQLAAPWFQQHVGPYLAGPPERRVGEVVASTALG